MYHGLNKVKLCATIPLAPALSADGPASGLRGQCHRLERQPVVNCIQREFFFCNRVVPDWNILPNYIISPDPNIILSAGLVNYFKNQMDKYFPKLLLKNKTNRHLS